MSYELHHLNKRNGRAHAKESVLVKKVLDKMAYVVAIIGPLSSLDQVLTLWREKNAAGVSLVVWLVILFTSIFWSLYATVHKERVIFLSHIIWIVLTSIILCEIVLFS